MNKSETKHGIAEHSHGMTPRLAHTMLRVANLERSIDFYTEKLGMRLFRTERYPAGQFTLAFVGYGDERSGATIELTHNWNQNSYDRGSAYGHIALEVNDLRATCKHLDLSGVTITRQPGPMSVHSPDRAAPELIAFIEDPDGYRIELIESQSHRLQERQ